MLSFNIHKKSKIFAAFALGIASLTGATAQEANFLSKQAQQIQLVDEEKLSKYSDPFAHRSAILNNPAIQQSTLSIGWFTGIQDNFEMRVLLYRFLPLSNYLSEIFQQVTVLETAKSDKELAEDGIEENLDMVYTSALMATQLVKHGWSPVVGRSDNIEPVIVTASNLKVDKPEDLKGKKIFAAAGSTISTFIHYSMLKDGILKDKNDDHLEFKSNTAAEMQTMLREKLVDGIVLRSSAAESFVKGSQGRFKIAYRGKKAPGHMLLASPKFKKEQEKQLTLALLRLTPANQYHLSVLKGLDGFSQDNNYPWKIITKEELDDVEQVFSYLQFEPIKAVKK